MKLLLRCGFWVVVAVQLLLTDFVLLVYSWVTFSFGRPNFWQSLLHMNQGPSSLSPVQWMLFAVCFAGFLVVVGCRIPEGRMGLGVSLLHPSARTLLERFGFERVNLEVRRYDKAYESLVYRAAH